MQFAYHADMNKCSYSAAILQVQLQNKCTSASAQVQMQHKCSELRSRAEGTSAQDAVEQFVHAVEQFAQLSKADVSADHLQG